MGTQIGGDQMTENTSQTCEMCDSNEIDANEGRCKSCGHYNDDDDCQCDECLDRDGCQCDECLDRDDDDRQDYQ